jgi:predicted nucleic acid-binding protein
VTLSVLDTSVLIAARPAGIEGELGISVVTVSELQFGDLLAPDDERRATVGRAERDPAQLRALARGRGDCSQLRRTRSGEPSSGPQVDSTES